MKSAAELIPAPKRGRYDRTISRHARQAAQQERVLAAVAAVAASGRELSVASVVEHAGIGRNTFYEYFDDVEHALIAITGRVRRDLTMRVEPALSLARTPLERVRALARAWSEAVSPSSDLALLALRSTAQGSTQLSELGQYVASVLENETQSRSALPGLADRLRTTAVAAVFDTVTRLHLADPNPASDLPRTLAELALRLLR